LTSTAPSETLRQIETGLIYFYYRPKVEFESPNGLDDVQK
jgi:hypothetical protein